MSRQRDRRIAPFVWVCLDWGELGGFSTPHLLRRVAGVKLSDGFLLLAIGQRCEHIGSVQQTKNRRVATRDDELLRSFWPFFTGQCELHPNA